MIKQFEYKNRLIKMYSTEIRGLYSYKILDENGKTLNDRNEVFSMSLDTAIKKIMQEVDELKSPTQIREELEAAGQLHFNFN